MAKEQDLKLEGQEGEEEQSGGGKKKLIIIIAIVLIVLLAGGGAAAFFLLGGEEEEVTDEEVVEEVVEEPELVAVYVKLKPEFVISFQVGTRQRYVQASIEIMTRQQSIVDALELHEPMVRNEVINIVSRQEFAKLRTAEGRVALQNALKSAITEMMEREAGSDGVEAVLFTNFVMQ
ncbi:MULTISPECIES: flagellar basal body-associated FliL family protein [Thalassolituus]|uniref:flagellar basal body-associated FliL family protein n=1 Tax=Thalassolituus TaxID=187492 RepID=UPI002649B442|nr:MULTISPECIES: flagellar basal body-associated FliL family protein [Thalassolituus]|tara:strand:- start:34417 stop:34947 length:531 start_codon:yes stop_codon:yes gene_type:complete